MSIIIFNVLSLFVGTFLLSTVYYDIINIFKNYQLKIKGYISSVDIVDNNVLIQVKWSCPSGYINKTNYNDIFVHKYKINKKFNSIEDQNIYLNAIIIKEMGTPFYLSGKVIDKNILDIKKTDITYVKILLNLFGLLMLALFYQYFKDFFV